MLSLIVAMGANNVIGYENDMPWHLPKDLKFFRETTTGHTVIMGRKTYESIGKPLPNRKNIVLTRSETNFPEGVEVMNDIKAIYELNAQQPYEEIFIIVCGKSYKQVMPLADRMYITEIYYTFDVDTFFSKFSEKEWTLTNKLKD